MFKRLACSVALLLSAERTAALDPWSKTDTALELAYVALEAGDLLTTSVIVKHPEKYYEVNPLLGKHPSHLEVDAFFAATTLAHAGIAYVLPSSYRRAWQLVTIGCKGAMLGWNIHAGLEIATPW